MKEETIKKMSLERMAILQAKAELEIIKKGKKSFSDAYPDVIDKYANINDVQTNILRDYLKEKYAKMNINIKEEIEKTGETYSNNKISKYETDELIKEADEIIMLISIILDRKKRLLKND